MFTLPQINILAMSINKIQYGQSTGKRKIQKVDLIMNLIHLKETARVNEANN